MIHQFLQLLLNLRFLKRLQNIPCLNIVKVNNVQTALESAYNLFGVVLESFEGSEIAGVDNYTVADNANFAVAVNLSFPDNTTGYCSNFGYVERFQHFKVAVISSLISGESIPSIAALISSIAS
jgi:hypothetical protein